MQIGDRIKIGYASVLETRIKSYPPNAVLLASHPGTKALEKDMHLKFDMYRTEGREWFSVSPALLAHIEDVKAKYPQEPIQGMRKANERKGTLKPKPLAGTPV